MCIKQLTILGLVDSRDNSAGAIATAVVVPALEEIKALLNKAGWQCEVRREKDQGVHFTIYRENMKAGIGAGGSERPYMSFQLEKVKNAVLVYVATIGSSAGLGSFVLRPNYRRVCPS